MTFLTSETSGALFVGTQAQVNGTNFCSTFESKCVTPGHATAYADCAGTVAANSNGEVRPRPAAYPTLHDTWSMTKLM